MRSGAGRSRLNRFVCPGAVRIPRSLLSPFRTVGDRIDRLRPLPKLGQAPGAVPLRDPRSQQKGRSRCPRVDASDPDADINREGRMRYIGDFRPFASRSRGNPGASRPRASDSRAIRGEFPIAIIMPISDSPHFLRIVSHILKYSLRLTAVADREPGHLRHWQRNRGGIPGKRQVKADRQRSIGLPANSDTERTVARLCRCHVAEDSMNLNHRIRARTNSSREILCYDMRGLVPSRGVASASSKLTSPCGMGTGALSMTSRILPVVMLARI